jgi:hypothetical protein
MGNFVGGRVGPAGARMESLFCAGDAAHRHLWTLDYGDHAPERRGGRPGGRFRRRWQPDGVRPARSGHIPLQGHDVVRHHVHAYVHGVDHASELGCGASRQLRVATVLKDVKAAAARGSHSNSPGVSACPGRSSSSSACAIEISYNAQNPASDSLPRITAVSASHC